GQLTRRLEKMTKLTSIFKTANRFAGISAGVFAMAACAFAAPKPTVTIGFSPNSTVSAGTPVTITASVTTGCGFLRINNVTGGGILASGPANSVSGVFDTTGLAGTSVEFEAHFDPG